MGASQIILSNYSFELDTVFKYRFKLKKWNGVRGHVKSRGITFKVQIPVQVAIYFGNFNRVQGNNAQWSKQITTISREAERSIIETKGSLKKTDKFGNLSQIRRPPLANLG